MHKRILTLGILFLLVFSAFIPMSLGFNIRITNTREQPSISSRGNTLYVGGTGPDNYTKIQDALDDAVNGDTVFVYDRLSPYYESIDIIQCISLIGEDRDTTIIDGGGSEYVIYTTESRVKIDNFEIRNGNKAGIRIPYGRRTIIANCTIHDSSEGIFLEDADYSKIINCILYNNQEIGIYLYSCSYNYINNCTVYQNSYGIYLLESGINQIFNCIAYSNGLGIYLMGNSCKKNDIVNCITFDNNNDGIQIGIYASSNRILNCITYDNPEGIKIYHENSGNRVSYCDISNNGRGVNIDNSKNNRIYHNNFIDNTVNAKATKYNYWDDGYPSGGNYWSDYNGIDDDGDGIGDTPYPIPGDSNEDRYPFMEPWDGNIFPFVYFTFSPGIPYPEQTVSFDASRSYDADGIIVLYEWDWDDDGEFDEEYTTPIATHSWSISGSYPVVVRVTDDDGLFTTEKE